MASMMLTHSWLKCTDTPLFPMSAFTCLQTSNIKVFKRDEASSCALTDLETGSYTYILYDIKLFTKHYICMNPKVNNRSFDKMVCQPTVTFDCPFFHRND